MFRTILRCLAIAYWSVLTVCKMDIKALRHDLNAAKVSAIFPDDAGYANASLAYNRRINVLPVAFAFPTTVKQVSDAVKAGAAQRFRIVAMSGGHSYIANGLGGKDGALVINMRNFNKITVHTNNNTAVIETGNRVGDVALALNEEGVALPHAVCPYVGMGGQAGYGGYSFVSRLWGLTLDNIVSATVVLANGAITKASCTMNPDLFWALRGSASSFGIVISLEVNTFAVPHSAIVFRYDWTFDVNAATNALVEFQKYAQSDIPPELSAEINIGKGSSKGTVDFELVGGYYGLPAQFNASIAAYLSMLQKPETSSVRPGTYIASVEALGGVNLNTSTAPDSHDTFYAKSLMTPEDTPMSDKAIRAFFTYAINQGFATTTNWFVQFELYGGSNSKINSVPRDATAFVQRSSLFTVQLYASSANGERPYPNEGFSFLDNMVSSIVKNSPKDWNYGAYANYLDDKLLDWQHRYYGDHYNRLMKVKRSVDPRNIFSFPMSIEE